MATTSSLLRVRSSSHHDPEPVRTALREAAPVFDALASQTARTIFTALADEPKPVSEVAEAVGTSTQNALYHAENLHDANLLTIVDTWYSEKGREMNIYAARHDTIVLTMESSV